MHSESARAQFVQKLQKLLVSVAVLRLCSSHQLQNLAVAPGQPVGLVGLDCLAYLDKVGFIIGVLAAAGEPIGPFDEHTVHRICRGTIAGWFHVLTGAANAHCTM